MNRVPATARSSDRLSVMHVLMLLMLLLCMVMVMLMMVLLRHVNVVVSCVCVCTMRVSGRVSFVMHDTWFQRVTRSQKGQIIFALQTRRGLQIFSPAHRS